VHWLGSYDDGDNYFSFCGSASNSRRHDFPWGVARYTHFGAVSSLTFMGASICGMYVHPGRSASLAPTHTARLAYSASVVLLAFGVSACNGGGGNANPLPTPQPQVSISVSPTSVTVQSGQTQQFTATVTGTSNTAVAWTASSGSISTAGLYTAPVTSINVTATITAVTQADSSKSAQATVTVTPPSTPTTTSVSSPFNGNSAFISLASPGATTVKLLGSGFASTDTQVLTPTLPLTTRIFASATEFDLGLGFDNNHFRPGFYGIVDCNGPNCSNPPAAFAFLGDGLSRLGMGADGRFCQRDAGTLACFNADRTAISNPFSVGNGVAGIAFDSAKNLAVVAGSGAGAVALFDITNPTGPGHSDRRASQDR